MWQEASHTIAKAVTTGPGGPVPGSITAGRLRHILFDLDETLYPPACGLMEAINYRISLYMLERLGMEESLVKRLRPEYFRRYGTTMRGLAIHYGIDCDDYLAFVHDLQVERFIGADPDLDASLARIPWPKSIFTNASRAHAVRVLTVLGIERHFGAIFDVASVGYESKPAAGSYIRVIAQLGVPAGECALVDDSMRNLQPARELGMATVLVDGRQQAPVEGVDALVARASQVADVLPDIARGSRKWVCGAFTLTQKRLL